MPRTDRLDSLGMAELLRNFPQQIEEAIQIGEDFGGPPPPSAAGAAKSPTVAAGGSGAGTLRGPIEKIVFVGMGGSAIGGDVIRSLLARDLPLPLSVSRHYLLPAWVDSKTLCIFSSYSGNTEETLAGFQEGMKKKLRSVVITSGGELARLAQKPSLPWIEIPKGLPPRAALGYSVFPILKLFSKLNLWKWDAPAVRETLALLKKLNGEKFSPEVPLKSNPARQAAKSLWGRFVAIYAGTELLETAALRFRNQIEENAKALASHHLLPEMNHNEILGWENPGTLIGRSIAVFLRDSEDHPRIQLRFKITRKLLAERGIQILEMHSEGKSRLARLFSAILLGDWASYYLALLYGVDPTPVAIIEDLKKQLARAK